MVGAEHPSNSRKSARYLLWWHSGRAVCAICIVLYGFDAAQDDAQDDACAAQRLRELVAANT